MTEELGREEWVGESPKVTVLMCCYNAEKFVVEAINSVTQQTFTDWELVVIDDGSTDGTPGLLAQFTDQRIRVYRLSVNQGIPSALNIGLQMSRGLYIARLDADDVASPFRLDRQVAYLDSHPQTVALGGSMGVVGSGGLTSLVRKSSDSMGKLLLRGNQYLSSSVTFRREIVQGNNLAYSVQLPNAQDYDFWLQLSRYGRLAQLEEKFGEYRFHQSQQTKLNALRQRRSALGIQAKAILGRYQTPEITLADATLGTLYLIRHLVGYGRLAVSLWLRDRN